MEKITNNTNGTKIASASVSPKVATWMLEGLLDACGGANLEAIDVDYDVYTTSSYHPLYGCSEIALLISTLMENGAEVSNFTGWVTIFRVFIEPSYASCSDFRFITDTLCEYAEKTNPIEGLVALSWCAPGQLLIIQDTLEVLVRKSKMGNHSTITNRAKERISWLLKNIREVPEMEVDVDALQELIA